MLVVRRPATVKSSIQQPKPHSFPAHETNVPELENTSNLLELRKRSMHTIPCHLSILSILAIPFMFSFMNSMRTEHKDLPVEYTYLP